MQSQNTTRLAPRQRRHLFRDRRGQRHCGPSGSGGGDPLIVLVRKPALKIWLESGRAGLHVPRTVLELRAQQEPDAAPPDITGGNADLMQRVERLAGGVGVAW